MKIIDISLKISEDMAVYPGNPSPDIEKYSSLPERETNESEICLGSHTGTHVDAPEHVKEGADSANDLDLEAFYGEAQVLDLTGCKEKVDKEDLKEKQLEKDILLLKTDNANHDYSDFRQDFTYLTLEAVEYLIGRGVKTVGIDYLSLVEFDGGKNAEKAHLMANEHMNVVEGLDLREVESGNYIFSGLPLNMETDGAPMRAVLIED